MAWSVEVAGSWQRRIVEAHKWPRVLALISFLVSFGIVRLIAYSIKYDWFPFLHNVSVGGGLHIHHMVFGIVLLLAIGYVAVGFSIHQIRPYLALLYGIAAALTLDEFALWLNLSDVYWAKQGRESVDAVIVGATVLGIGVVSSNFLGDLAHLFLRRTFVRRP